MPFPRGKFEAELNDIEKLLRKLDFFEERNYYPSEDFDPATYRAKNYIENWRSLISDNIYNFILSDNSIIKFKLNANLSQISYVFFECPYACLTYNDYLEEFNLNDLSSDLEDESYYNDKLFEDYYNEYLLQCPLKENPMMIRYDYDSNSYFEGVHPVSHIHIGHKNDIRIGLKKILSPKSFVSFILRQHYPAFWRIIISGSNSWISYFITEKATLSDIHTKYWNMLDTSEFHLE